MTLRPVLILEPAKGLTVQVRQPMGFNKNIKNQKPIGWWADQRQLYKAETPNRMAHLWHIMKKEKVKKEGVEEQGKKKMTS